MVVAGREGMSKKHYRTFNIKSTDITPGDDFGMMREVLTRRFTRLVNEYQPADESADADKDAMPDWPDVLLIDGGKGQMSAVRETLKQFDLPQKVTLIGIAKGEERNAGRETFILEGREPLCCLHAIQCFIMCSACEMKPPFCHWHTPRETIKTNREKPARRNRRDWPNAQESIADPFRFGQSGERRDAERSAIHPRHFKTNGAKHLRSLQSLLTLMHASDCLGTMI